MSLNREAPTVLITGGRRGIGLGIALAFARVGYQIAITGLSAPSQSHEVVAELQSLGAPQAAYFQSDVADLAGHQSTITEVLARFGRIDNLVNNAGMAAVERGDFLALAPDNFMSLIATNLTGTVFFTQTVVKAMLAQKPSPHPRAIINISSVSAAMSSSDRLDYCISKAGLSAFSQGLAVRLADAGIAVFEVRPGIIRTDMTAGVTDLADAGIAVFEVRPGIIRTDMTAGVTDKYDRLIESGGVPMRRWGETDDLGRICAMLASGAFGFATGSVIHADGGLSIPRL